MGTTTVHGKAPVTGGAGKQNSNNNNPPPSITSVSSNNGGGIATGPTQNFSPLAPYSPAPISSNLNQAPTATFTPISAGFSKAPAGFGNTKTISNTNSGGGSISLASSINGGTITGPGQTLAQATSPAGIGNYYHGVASSVTGTKIMNTPNGYVVTNPIASRNAPTPPNNFRHIVDVPSAAGPIRINFAGVPSITRAGHFLSYDVPYYVNSKASKGFGPFKPLVQPPINMFSFGAKLGGGELVRIGHNPYLEAAIDVASYYGAEALALAPPVIASEVALRAETSLFGRGITKFTGLSPEFQGFIAEKGLQTTLGTVGAIGTYDYVKNNKPEDIRFTALALGAAGGSQAEESFITKKYSDLITFRINLVPKKKEYIPPENVIDLKPGQYTFNDNLESLNPGFVTPKGVPGVTGLISYSPGGDSGVVSSRAFVPSKPSSSSFINPIRLSSVTRNDLNIKFKNTISSILASSSKAKELVVQSKKEMSTYIPGFTGRGLINPVTGSYTPIFKGINPIESGDQILLQLHAPQETIVDRSNAKSLFQNRLSDINLEHSQLILRSSSDLNNKDTGSLENNPVFEPSSSTSVSLKSLIPPIVFQRNKPYSTGKSDVSQGIISVPKPISIAKPDSKLAQFSIPSSVVKPKYNTRSLVDTSRIDALPFNDLSTRSTGFGSPIFGGGRNSRKRSPGKSSVKKDFYVPDFTSAEFGIVSSKKQRLGGIGGATRLRPIEGFRLPKGNKRGLL